MVDIESKGDNNTNVQDNVVQQESGQLEDNIEQDKCKVELSVVGGSCFVNKQKIKPTILLSVGGGRRKHRNKQAWASSEWTSIEKGIMSSSNRSGELVWVII